MTNKVEKTIAGLTTILAMLIWSAVFCQAQPVPVLDCCQQAIQYKDQLDAMTKKYSQAKAVLEGTRQAGNDLIEQKDLRIKAVQDKANSKLIDASDREKDLKQALLNSNGQLSSLQLDLEAELIRTRFLGLGRKAWVRSMLKRLRDGRL